MNNLILDFGNTYKKVAIVNDGKQIYFVSKETWSLSDIIQIEEKYSFQRVIFSSVVEKDSDLENYIQSKYLVIKLSSTTPIPIINNYKTVETLGYDRLACAVAANHFFTDRDCLIIQMGTCITYDFINKNAGYLGGSISPGLTMRIKSLHQFTKKLPKVTYKPISFLIGDTTENSILSGVINGIINECNGFISQYKKNYPKLKVIVTGGDMPYFEKLLQNEIVTYPNLVLLGLSIILNYNVEYKNKN